MNEAKARGCVAFRSAGSHSPIDVVEIDYNSKVIRLIQCKPESMSENAKEKIYQENAKLEGTYLVCFDVV